jgi:hypothetical protein
VSDRARRIATLIVLIASFAVLLLASRTQGNVRDEGYYFDAAEQYSAWYVELVPNLVHGQFAKSFSRGAVDRAFTYNHEHPALMKSLFGLSWHFLHKCDCPRQGGLHPVAYRQKHASLNLLDEETAFRVPTMLLTALMVALAFAWAARFSAAVGLAAAGMSLFAARLFFDAELACFDAPIAALWFLTVYAYWRSRSQDRAGRRWARGAGVIFGLALATKHNAFFIPPVLIVHALWVDRRELWTSLRERRLPRGEAFPRALLWMATLGLLVYFACWPWMWFQTVARFREYVAFHVHHVYYNFEYLGRNYNKPPFPRAFVFGMTLVTVPATTLLLAVSGALTWLRDARRGETTTPAGTGLLVGLNALAPMLVLTLTGAPIFGATKHFHAAIPFLALLGAYALAALIRALGAPRVLAIALSLLAVVPAAVDTWRSHPYALSHYAAFVGGPDGGASLGMNRQFWGYATRGLLPYINTHAQRNAPIYWHDTNQSQINLYVRTGRLRPDVRNTGLEEPGVQASNLGIIIHERHFAKYEYWFWDFYGTTRPSTVLTHEDVPIVTLYERPR